MTRAARGHDGPPSGFVPARGLGNPHLQTLWSPLLRRVAVPPRVRERLELPDGDYVDCDWCCPPQAPADAPTVLLLHGLAGCSGSTYMVGMQQALQARGWRSVALNFRGSTGTPNRLARGYHAGDTGDLAALCRHVRNRFPHSPRAAIGYSLGGNVLLKWLGEQGRDAPLKAVCAVSVPLQLERCTAHLDQGLSRLYRAYLLRVLKRRLQDKYDHFRRHGNRAQLAAMQRLGDWRNARTFREFDGRVVAPLHGFADADDYYARASSRGDLGRIRVATLLVQARDDPLLPPDILPGAAELPASVTLEAYAHGGHVGFVEGSLGRPGYWLERRLPAFLAAGLAAADRAAAEQGGMLHRHATPDPASAHSPLVP